MTTFYHNIFDAVNILISLCLAFVTWLTLSYFEIIEGRQTSNFEKSLDLDTSFMQTTREKGIELYLNFFWIFACIYALTKITELTERYIGERNKSKVASEAVSSMNVEWERTLKVYETDKQRLAKQIEDLRKKNKNLEEFLNQTKAYNMELINENNRKAIAHEYEINGLSVMNGINDINREFDLSLKNTPSNIFITNRHFHLTRQFFVNDGNINVDLRRSGGVEIFGEPAEVWIKYLQMRKYYIGPMADPMLYMGDAGKMEPLVISTEQLQKLQGLSAT